MLRMFFVGIVHENFTSVIVLFSLLVNVISQIGMIYIHIGVDHELVFPSPFALFQLEYKNLVFHIGIVHG